ncbi:hypothetical protein [Aeoliella mucimassa]|uniref:Uncharacterized protein n=1 Tax=Aeoliella mucimassa TaxID=2527972 RepID=A0A518AW00_9BACT|nr:hypothetical protein [Aeoliella mucimassa]QDU58886.1 hypothetical protein Pan181_51260 [Aeoliella mucimassa]
MFAESARLIEDVASNPLPVATGMSKWFDYCDSVAPAHTELWTQLRQLDFDSDQERLTNWLSELLTAEPPSEEINGLWFGLFNPCTDDGEAICQTYIGGSTDFDADSESDEWVCNLKYLPDGRYAESKVLPEIYRRVELLEEDNLFYLGEAFLCHGYLALVISNWCHGPMRTQLLKSAPIRAVVMGHDSGDFYRMAVLKP